MTPVWAHEGEGEGGSDGGWEKKKKMGHGVPAVRARP